MIETSSLIELKNISKWFGDFRALSNCNLSVASNEVVVICGPSGSGKSTLIQLINGLEAFQEGDVVYKGQSVRSGAIKLPVLRAKIGMVFQQFELFPHLSVIKNLTLAQEKVLKRGREESENKAVKLIDRVGLRDQLYKYPAQLSGGQQQRVAIARALCMDPEVMLFDEPTSALDPEMINEVLNVMVDVADEGMTMLCVTHEMGFARKVADKVVFMADGNIVETDTTEKFFNSPESNRTQEFLSQILH